MLRGSRLGQCQWMLGEEPTYLELTSATSPCHACPTASEGTHEPLHACTATIEITLEKIVDKAPLNSRSHRLQGPRSIPELIVYTAAVQFALEAGRVGAPLALLAFRLNAASRSSLKSKIKLT